MVAELVATGLVEEYQAIDASARGDGREPDQAGLREP